MTAAHDDELGWIELTIEGSASTLGLRPARVFVDRQSVTTVRGRNLIPVPPGRHHIDVQIWAPEIFGQAKIEVEVAAGQTVPVWYAAPRTFMGGAIGLEPQRAPGRWFNYAVLAMLLLVVIGSVAYGASR